MPRQIKSKIEVPELAPVVESTPVVDQITSSVTKTKKETKPKTAKAVPAVVAVDPVTPTVVPVAVPVVTVAPTAVVDTSDSDAADLAAQSSEFLIKLSQISALLGSLKTEYRTLEKKWFREIKTAQKSQAKRKRKSGNRQPSGFVKPTKISDELAKFLEKPTGTEMARTDVTREINKYIRSHNLQDAKNGRKINPDDKLQTLLKLNKTDELTYFNLQRYMSPHFAKSEKSLAASASLAV